MTIGNGKDDKMKKLDPDDALTHSPDLVADNVAQLKALFPELITESASGAAINVDLPAEMDSQPAD